MNAIDWIQSFTWDTLPWIHTAGIWLPIGSLLFYLIGVLQILPQIMSHRDPVQVGSILPYWNLFLFVGSSTAASIYLVALIRKYWNSSFYEMICDPYDQAFTGLYGFMAWIFLISKILEFVDTIFTVLKKKPISFLHWYHHATVMAYTWLSVSTRNSLGQWFGLVNYWVHTFMYYYYWRTTSGYKITWAKTLTTMQISQMGVGIVLLGIWTYFWITKGYCNSTNGWLTVVSGLVMYGSYLVLFLRFYGQRYKDEDIGQKQESKKPGRKESRRKK